MQMSSLTVLGARLPLKAGGEDPSLPVPASGSSRHTLACGDLPPVSTTLFPWLSLCVQMSLFHKDISHAGVNDFILT